MNLPEIKINKAGGNDAIYMKFRDGLIEKTIVSSEIEGLYCDIDKDRNILAFEVLLPVGFRIIEQKQEQK